MATIELGMHNFESTITENGIVLIDFWAAWCGPCRQFGPIFEKASDRHADAVFAKVDTEKEMELAGHFGVQSIPTLAIFRDQILLFQQPGALPESALDQIIDQVKALNMDEIRAQIAAEQQKQGQA